MSEWKTKPLSDVAKVIDSLHKTPTYADYGFPMVRVTDIQGGYLELSGTFKVSEDTYEEFSKKHKPKHGDLVFSRVGTYGSVSFVKNSTPFCLGQNTVFIVPKINPYFLFYFLNSPYAHHQINCFATGSTQKTISLASIKSIEVFTPPQEEQENIASTLSCLDRKISNLREQNETLERIAQTLFKHWFVDFEFPNEDGKPYKSSGGEMVRSELGEIPAGWNVGKLGEVADVKSSKRIFLSEYVELGIPFYRSKEIIELSSGQEISTLLYISEERFREIESKFGAPEVGEILVTSVGTIGVTYIVSSRDKFYFKDGNLTWIKNFRGGFNGVIVYYWLKSDSARNQIEQNTIGSTQKALTIQALSGLNIILSDSKVLSRYRDFVESIHNKRESNTQKIQTLTKARDVLLPKLMSGKLRITAS